MDAPPAPNVQRVPWWKPEHARIARQLPNVCPEDRQPPNDGWQRAHRANRHVLRNGDSKTNTWAGATAVKLRGNPYAPLIDETLAPSVTTCAGTAVVRAVKLRVRFLGVTAKNVNRAFNDHGGAARFIYNSALSDIKSLPRDQQARAFNMTDLAKKYASAGKVHAPQTLKRKQDETDIEFSERQTKTLKQRQRNADRQAAKGITPGEFVRDHGWLSAIDSQVKQHAVIDLVKAFEANVAKQQLQRQRGQRVRCFELKRKRRNTSSSWTFVLPAQRIAAEHVPRPTNGPAVRGQPQPQRQPHMWTKLKLPRVFGGDVYLSGRADLTDGGKLLADVRFTRSRNGIWSAVVHREAKATPAGDGRSNRKARRAASRGEPVPTPQHAARGQVFLDPGSRNGWTGYAPNTSETVTYLPHGAGCDVVLDIAQRADALISKTNEIRQGRTVHSLPPEDKRRVQRLNTQKLRLFAKATNMVRDAHRRVAADLVSRYSEIYLPIFETSKMVKRKRHPDDPVRKLNNKAARALVTLSHYKFRTYLAHACNLSGAKLFIVTEEYTTKGCPFCGVCSVPNSNRVFRCTGCGYTGDRDEKAGFTLAVKLSRV